MFFFLFLLGNEQLVCCNTATALNVCHLPQYQKSMKQSVIHFFRRDKKVAATTIKCNPNFLGDRTSVEIKLGCRQVYTSRVKYVILYSNLLSILTIDPMKLAKPFLHTSRRYPNDAHRFHFGGLTIDQTKTGHFDCEKLSLISATEIRLYY